MEDKASQSGIETGCRAPQQHRDHICLLMEKGLTEEIRQRTTRPAYVCGNCGARGNARENLCNPSPLPAPGGEVG